MKRGGEFVVAPINPAASSYIFTAILMKGKRLEWVVNYQDDKNYGLFQLDDKYLVRTQFANGKGRFRQDPHSIKNQRLRQRHDCGDVERDHTQLSCVQQQWQAVDKWERPGGALHGKFGFHVPGKDQLGVSDFRFVA